MSLKYSKDASIKGFAGLNEKVETAKFADDVIKTPAQRIDEVNSIANNCRWWYEPTFADETKYLPVKDGVGVNAVIAASLTNPPQKAKDDVLMNALLVGLGVFVIYKLLS